MTDARIAPTDDHPGKKWDGLKRRWDLFPWHEAGEVVDVLGHGAEKYGDDNWKHVDKASDRYFAAAIRHLAAWREGERIDPESGRSHLAHAVCSIFFLMCGDRQGADKVR